MNIGDLFVKMADGTLTQDDKNTLRIWGNLAQANTSIVNGWIKPGSNDPNTDTIQAKTAIFELIKIYNGSVQSGKIDGDIFLGEDLADPAKASFHVFSKAQVYNGESMGAGDLLLGDNSEGKPNIFWDASVPEIQMRSGELVLNRMSNGSSMSPRQTVLTTGQTTITHFLETTLYFTTEEIDDGGWHSNTTNTNRVTVDKAGVYSGTVVSEWEGIGGDGLFWIRVSIWKNGTIWVGGTMATYEVSAFHKWACFTSPYISLDADDYLEVHVEHVYGSDYNIESCIFTVVEVV
jgi:hypothetical protein